ncbi:MAG: type II secretion system protein [Bacilli bacterium]|nr:type II secretion system protein [Bacilli bacterium]
MKSRGFTLIELLAAIVLLAVISLVTVPALIGVLDQSKEKLSEEQKLAIENAARSWGFKHLYLAKDGVTPSSSFVTLKDLQDGGYLEDKNLYKNLRTREKNINNVGVCIEFKSEQYVYTFTENVSECE